jgi:hypothetical protein
MNPQPHETTCLMMTIIFVIGIIASAIKSYNQTDGIILNDNFELGTINNNKQNFQATITYKPKTSKQQYAPQPSAAIKPAKKPIQKPVVKNKLKNEQPQKPVERKVYTPLQQDCYDALLVLGMGKKESKFVVNNTFNNHDINSVEEFLYTALRRK